jgi:hypothetical protein
MTLHEVLCAELLCHDVIALEWGEQSIYVSDWLMYNHSYCATQIHAHIIISKGLFSIFPRNYTVHVSPQEELSDDYIVTLNVIELYATCHL